METYTTKQLADMFGIHSNTIRLYERQDFISPAIRGENGYRIFWELHILQVRVCRSIFGYPFFNRRIRETGNQVLFASARRDYIDGIAKVKAYTDSISAELDTAHKTADMLKKWITTGRFHMGQKQECLFTRKEAAIFLGVTKETVRNWERNVLVSSKANEKGLQCFDKENIEKMRIIYMLRSAGYSISAIHRSFSALKQEDSDPITILNNPSEEDINMVGDRWVYELTRLHSKSQELSGLFSDMEKTCTEGEIWGIIRKVKKRYHE